MSGKNSDTKGTEETDYKGTLNLPRTDFPMRAGLPAKEPGLLERWTEIGIYERLREKAETEGDRKPFTLHDGPPYANGHLHIGHALNKILKDMVVRSQQMLGRDARYIPGWDCHGLPIEWKVEERHREEGRDKDDVGIVAIRRECREFAEGWIDVQREEFKRLGVTGAWEDPYLTMDFHAERVIAEEFQKFLMNGTLYLGSKPVMWSPVEQTALAEAEVEYHDKESPTVLVKFRVAADGSPKEGPSLEGAHVVIWTTTPWTLPSNKAVVWGEEIAYGLYEVTGRPATSLARIGNRYLLADKLAEDVLGRAGLEEGMFRRLRDVAPDVLRELRLEHPLSGVEGARGEWDGLVDFRAADFVTEDEGTGFVHCAPSHGMEEYELYRDLGMLDQVITHNVLEDGRFREDLPLFGGKAILGPDGGEGDANAAVAEALQDADRLLAQGRITHSYPHSWRSKAPVIYRNTPQWFAAIDRPVGDGQDEYGTTIRERALRSIDELVTWTPNSGRNRLHAMISARPDWVLSRQRAWGVPLTCFTRRDAAPTEQGFLLRDERVNARILEAFETEGADAWYADGAKERFLGGDHDPEEYDQVFDILDVWFDSGTTHAFVLRDRDDGTEDGLADLYLEGTDQHRGWFQSSMLQSCGTRGRAPYRGVLTHGFTLDEKGMKMSKSIGNTVAPDEVVEQYGADILRLWAAQTDYTADQRIGPEILKGVADGYRRLRNTIRFILGSIPADGDLKPGDLKPGDLADSDWWEREASTGFPNLPELERWVLHRLAELDARVREGYVRYDFQGIVQALFNFATSEMSAFYFDIRKDSLYCDGATPERAAARAVLDALFQRLTTWLAPVLAFTMDEVWRSRFGENGGPEPSVHLVDIPDSPGFWRDDALAGKFAELRSVRRVVTAALEDKRKNGVIGSSLEAAPVLHVEDPGLRDRLGKMPLADICITSNLELAEGPGPEDAFRLPEYAGASVVVEIAKGEKCGRCWKILPDVGTHGDKDVCERCESALAELAG